MATLRKALLLAYQPDSKFEIAAGLRHIGNAARAAATPARAVHLYWVSGNIIDSIGEWQQEDEAEFERDLAACHASLSESAFAEAVEQGRAMSMEQAIDYVLELSPTYS